MVFGKIFIYSEIAVIVFLAGIAMGSILEDSSTLQMPSSLFLSRSAELSSPSDHIPEESIKVYTDRVVLDISDASWASFTDTNSMDPFIDAGANSIEIRPSSPDDINVGDVVSFRTMLADGIVIHRVISKGEDDKGIYFITKGDNNDLADPGKRRFEDITGVVVGVIY
ncbi:signal peptidase I [Candidatus Woesearchaeota archaeon]|nr:signal peptidase I [Candidatus Woesearchaeota archaeon]